ncbi:MAG: T9SS type A sorting domain-containing protein, partial [Lentimicrobiaceae bacterium]|nr:T9SS type A sorting domain-containing protein [Lentimicrobiaceae bacterium]
FHFDNYATILWNNTFILNLNKIAADGYELIDCKWYRNGVEEHKSSTINHYSYSAGPHKTDLLELAPTYYTYELITKNEGALCSTPKILTQYVDYGSGKMSVYPNPVYSGVALTIAGIKKGELLQVYNQYGACVYNAMVHDTTMKLTLHLSSGLYLVRAGDSITKILVLE